MHVDVAAAGLVLSAIGTLVVVVGAFAALRQLRHIRHGNELATLTELSAQFDSPEMLEARTFVQTQLAAAMHDETFVAELRFAPSGPRAQYVARVANFFELVGTYANYGALSTRMSFTLWGVIAVRHWELTRDAIAIFREERMVLRFFEDFAIRSDRWIHSNAFRRRLDRLARDSSGPRASG